MIVYIESNFIFELGLGRAARDSCARLCGLAREGRIQLTLPACALPEVRTALRKREASRLEALKALQAQRDDAQRHFAPEVEIYHRATEALRARTEHEAQAIDALLVELRLFVRIIPLDHDTFGEVDLFRSMKVLKGDGDLLIFGSIINDLWNRNVQHDNARSLFVTDDGDFLSTKPYLARYSCDLLTSYTAAVARLKGQAS